MPNLYRSMGNVRMVWLRGPRANRPNELQLLNAVSLHTKLLRAQRRNTGNVWDYGNVNVNVVPDKAKYELSDSRFGRPLGVLTIDPANPNHIQRRIPFYAPQNLAFNWGWPMDIGSWVVNYDGSFHSADRCAFYWEAGVPQIEFQPIPKLPCTYLVLFSVGDSVDVMSLQDELKLGECGDSLVELRAARSLLPSTEWEATDDEHGTNEKRRVKIRETLDTDIPLLEKQFLSDALIGTETTHGRQWSPLDLY